MQATGRLLSFARRHLHVRRSQSESPPANSCSVTNSPIRLCRASSSSASSRMMSTAVKSAPCTPMKKGHPAATTAPSLLEYDPVQVKLLEEECIIVDEDDKVLGSRSKKDCHLMSNINDGLLHRAFSVFLFNSKGELLIQQRSDAKITFPGCFTNSCCSHPLATPAELTEDPLHGVKKAAQRRMFAELGIPPEELPLDSFHYLTRIKYKAPSCDSAWGEHEIDYILFVQKDIKTMEVNSNEIKSAMYLSRNDVDSFVDMLEKRDEPLTPWFRLILDTFLLKWWDNLGNLKQFESHDTVHKLN